MKGGHGFNATDYYYDGQHLEQIKGEWIDVPSLHGTGCALSAAIATFLGKGFSLLKAVKAAKRYITKIIKNSITFDVKTKGLGFFTMEK